MIFCEIEKDNKIKEVFESFSLAKKIKKPISEHDILYLQEIFMIPGIHHIKVDSVISGRFIIKSILDSLNYYKNVACLTTFHLPVQKSVSDIYQEFVEKNYIPNLDERFPEFFSEEFYNDFLWIEISDDLITKSWYNIFEQQIINLNLYKILPTIVVSYDDV